MATRRVLIGNNEVLKPGVYDIEGTVTSGGDARRLTKADIQQGISSEFGNRVQVIDYLANDPQHITLSIQVMPGPAEGDIAPQQVLIVITALAIAAAAFFAWQFSIQVTATFKIIDDIIHTGGGQVAAIGGGIGIAALGLAVFVLLIFGSRKGKRHGS